MAAVKALREVSQAWARRPVRELLSPIRSEKHYRMAERFVDALMAIVGEDERHPLAGLLDVLALHMEAYEAEHHRIEGSSGREVLKFLMDQHGLKQADLAAVFGGQGNVSDVLRGKRELNVRQIRALSKRFGVSPAVFFDEGQDDE